MKPITLPRLLCALPFVTVLTLTPAALQAQSVSWAGTMGERVVLVIDGRARVAGAGSVIDGVRVHRVGVREVEYEVGGVRQTLAAGGAAVAVGDGAGRVPRTLVLRAGADQLYHVDCRVNGRPVAGVVDTGASQVSMSTARAAALGLDWSRGRPVAIQTANGQVRGWSVRLERLAVGAMEAREVEAVVLESELPHLLIGNSFLRRFQVVTQDSQLTLARAN